MAYTTPKTWAVGDVLTGADMNTYVRDNTAWITNDRPRCRVYRNSDQTLTTSTDTTISFGVERFDTGNLHSNSTNPTRITVPTGGDGMYLLTANVAFAANGTGLRRLDLLLNGATIIARVQEAPSSAGSPTTLSITTLYQLAASDYVEVQVWQNSGGNLNVSASNNFSPEFSACWMTL